MTELVFYRVYLSCGVGSPQELTLELKPAGYMPIAAVLTELGTLSGYFCKSAKHWTLPSADRASPNDVCRFKS